MVRNIMEQPDDFEFWTYADLHKRRIIGSRADLNRKQKLGFPHPVRLTRTRGGKALFRVSAVQRWIAENLTSADSAP